MKWRWHLAVVFAVVLLMLAVTTTVFVSADSGGVTPDKFCGGDVAWVVRGQQSLTDPKCAGTYVLDLEAKQSRFSSFAEAEKTRGGKDATYWFEPAKSTAVPTVRVTLTSTSTPVQSAVPIVADRVARLISLDQIYRSNGWRTWLEAVGVTCGNMVVEARQPEEETLVDSQGATHVVVSGLQVRGSCSNIPWPAILTTDRPGEVILTQLSRQYKPSDTNPSVLYTNVGLQGQGTVWADGSNWRQLKPDTTLTISMPVSTYTPTNTPAPTRTSMPTATATPTPISTATLQPTARPTATSVTMSSLSSQVLPQSRQNFFNATVNGKGHGLYWWGLILILLAVVAIGVGIFFLAKYLLARRRVPPANPNP